jgi:hypothetical protein
MVWKVCLEPIEQAQRHSATFAGKYFHLPINLLLRGLMQAILLFR